MTSPDLPRQIANAHSIFNIAVSAFLFPFVHQIAQFAAWLIPARKEDEKTKVTAYIDDMQYRVPAVALNEAARELNRLGEITAEMVENSCTALIEQKVELIPSVLDQEEKVVDPISKELGIFVDNLLREDLSQAQQKRAFQIKSLLVDIERVGDLAEDIAQYAEERQDHQVPFSSQAIGELDSVWKQAHHIYLLSLQSFIDGDKELADKVCVLESEFDQLYWKTRQAHIDRLESGLCHPEADVIYTETLRALERISDHADNLGVSVSRTLT